MQNAINRRILDEKIMKIIGKGFFCQNLKTENAGKFRVIRSVCPSGFAVAYDNKIRCLESKELDLRNIDSMQ